MKIELTPVSKEMGLIGEHDEMWVRALTNDQIGPQSWPDVLKKANEHFGSEPLKGYSGMVQFFSNPVPDDDDEWENYSYEQWFILRRVY